MRTYLIDELEESRWVGGRDLAVLRPVLVRDEGR